MLMIFGTPIFDQDTRLEAAAAAEQHGEFLLGDWLRQSGELVLTSDRQPVPRPCPLTPAMAPSSSPIKAGILNWVADGRSIPLRAQCDTIDMNWVNLDTGDVTPLNPKDDSPTPTSGKAVLEFGTLRGKATPPILHVSKLDLYRFSLTYVPAYVPAEERMATCPTW